MTVITNLTVSVTPEDIGRGVRFDGTACPIVHALRRLFPDSPFITADEDYLEIDGVGHFATPDEAAVFIDLFDDGIAVQPIEFSLRMPVDVAAGLRIEAGLKATLWSAV